MIILPSEITLLRSREKQTIRTDREEYSFYFDNFIYPLHADYDVKIICDYGRNYGDKWVISDFPYCIDSFPLTIAVYGENGKLLEEKNCIVCLREKDTATNPFRVLIAMGDSMTQAQTYLEHIAMKLKNISFLGSRSFNGIIAHEGRGGFSTADYRFKYQDPYAPSPYVFPKGIPARQYYGDITFWNKVNSDAASDPYVYDGYLPKALRDGMVYNREGALYCVQNGQETLFDKSPEWEFNFSKYMEQNQFENVDAISILIGTNDIMKYGYDNAEAGIAATMDNLTAMIHSIRAYDKQIPIILNPPILPTQDAYAFGNNFGCRKSCKESRYVGFRYLKAFLEAWDNRAKDRIYLTPMNAVIDPVLAFRRDSFRDGLYYSNVSIRTGESIHPNSAGYAQMGDALAAVIQRLRIEQ